MRPPTFQCSAPPRIERVRVLRRALAEWLERVVASDRDRWELVLTGSELCTAAVRAASAEAGATLVVTAEAEPGAVRIEVAEPIEGPADMQRVEASRPLAVAAAVSDRLCVRTRGALVLCAQKRVDTKRVATKRVDTVMPACP